MQSTVMVRDIKTCSEEVMEYMPAWCVSVSDYCDVWVQNVGNETGWLFSLSF